VRRGDDDAALRGAIAGTGAVILDTRKTTPGLRFLEKYAVQCGGARTTGSRSGTCTWSRTTTSAGQGVTNAINAIQRTRRDLLLEVEVESEDQLLEALRPEWTASW